MVIGSELFFKLYFFSTTLITEVIRPEPVFKSRRFVAKGEETSIKVLLDMEGGTRETTPCPFLTHYGKKLLSLKLRITKLNSP